MKTLLTILLSSLALALCAQTDTISKKLAFTGDFRFRLEQDWHSRKSDGTFRDDKSRFRYRLRFGMTYQLDRKSAFGARLRTGHLDDQQGPHITLGEGNGEFGLVPIGLEKLYFKYEHKWFSGWVGKNSILLQKEHELFWNDNTYPEGIALSGNWPMAEGRQCLQINAAHYVIQSRGKSFGKDSYLQTLQVVFKNKTERWSLSPALYHFNQVGNLPDGAATFDQSYDIFHFGAKVQVLQKPKLVLGLDYFANMADYSQQELIPADLKNETHGYVAWAKLGDLKNRGDWTAQLFLAHLEKYAVVDYFAQNDWARWDYSNVNSMASRLTNLRGMELRLGYAVNQKFNLVLITYLVEQLVPQGKFRETGDRVRLDLNVGF